MSERIPLSHMLLFGAFMFSVLLFVEWVSLKLTRTQDIHISPSQLKLIVTQGRSGDKTLQIFFVERDSFQLRSEELDFDRCKISLSADYDAAPYIKLIESGFHEKSAELYLPENTKIQYT